MSLAETHKESKRLDIPVLVDCDCDVIVWKDGSGAEIEFCFIHQRANDMLLILNLLVGKDNPPFGKPGHVDFGVAYEAARTLVIQIEGEL